MASHTVDTRRFLVGALMIRVLFGSLTFTVDISPTIAERR
jgi:hypothetical protein